MTKFKNPFVFGMWTHQFWVIQSRFAGGWYADVGRKKGSVRKA